MYVNGPVSKGPTIKEQEITERSQRQSDLEDPSGPIRKGEISNPLDCSQDFGVLVAVSGNLGKFSEPSSRLSDIDLRNILKRRKGV